MGNLGSISVQVQLVVFVVGLIILTPLLGTYMAQVFQGQRTFLHPVLRGCEKGLYRVAGVQEDAAMNWKQYATALLVFNLIGIVATFAFQLLQGYLPLNPQNLGAMTWDSALNTAVSFVTNTNWQSYSPENTMSYLTQMIALSVQNFLSAATGLVVAIAFARGIVARQSQNIGNFWVDLVRATLYILLPLSAVFAVFLVEQGVVQTFRGYAEATTLEGLKQIIALGPAASQIAIKQLGTNGGGFFNANSAHPFENPTPLTNFFEMFTIFLIPAALTWTFGSIVKARKHGWLIFFTMLAMFLGGLVISYHFEMLRNAVFGEAGLMEGKETRFGVFGSILFSVITTATSCGAVNAMHASLSPLSGGIALLNMMLGELIFGGVGSGLYAMILFALMTVFLAGLMVGRTPEYLGKKVEAREIKMVILGILSPSIVILLGTAVTVVYPKALESLANGGPHGFSEILYAFTSAGANNGSAFAGLNANTPYYNLILAVVMLIGRFFVLVPALAIAGSLAEKKYSPPSPGSFETDTPIFAVLLFSVIVIVGGLTFFPALSLGPIIEHFLMLSGQVF